METLSYDKLSEDEIEAGLASLDGWSIEDGELFREFEFSSYAHGVIFASSCGHLADQLNHHPDILISYQRVSVSLITHDSGGLTSYDLEMARRIQAIA